MHETLPIRSARVDDLPLWLAHGARMGLQPLLDTPFPTPGHGQGRSLGGGTVIGLPHLRSPADHRLHHGEPGAETRLHTRRGCPGPPSIPWTAAMTGWPAWSRRCVTRSAGAPVSAR